MPVSVPSVWPAVADMKSIVEHSRLFLDLVDSRRSRARSPPLPALTVLPTLLHPPTIVGRGYVSVLFVRLCVWLFVYQQDYCKSNRPISRKLGIIVGPTNPKNWLYTIGGDPVSDHGSLFTFHFRHRCRLRHFRRFISISHKVAGSFYETRRKDWGWQRNTSTIFFERSGGHPHPHPDPDQFGHSDSTTRSLMAEFKESRCAWRWRSYECCPVIIDNNSATCESLHQRSIPELYYTP